MPATHYKVWEWGSRVGRGAMDSCYVGVAGVAKRATDAHPYAVVNELVCGDLARVLRLPCPPGFIVDREGVPYHVSLNFNLSGEDLPPADATAIAANHPEVSWAIIAFDALIVNGDRHTRNLAYDEDREAIQLFDHSHALMTGNDPRARLEGLEDELGIGGHCLANAITTLDGLDEACDRIVGVPGYYIRDAVEAAKAVGLADDDATVCRDFILARQGRIEELIRTNRDRFAGVADELWNGDEPEEAEA